MFRQLKFAEITLAEGKPAVLSTVELPGGVFETMMASPDFGTEYKQLRTDNEAQALADFKRLFSAYHVPPLRGRYAKLAEDLRAAAAYGAEVARCVEDGGTCNFDAVALDLRGWCRAKVEQAAKAAAAKEYAARKGIVEEAAREENAPLSGVSDRPFCKGRNYDPDRYAPKSMEE